MKRFAPTAIVLMALIAFGAVAAVAQNAEMIAGQVTKVDESTQKVTIKHGPIKKFGMDQGMTMVFRAADGSILKGLKVGDRIRFAPERRAPTLMSSWRSTTSKRRRRLS